MEVSLPAGHGAGTGLVARVKLANGAGEALPVRVVLPADVAGRGDRLGGARDEELGPVAAALGGDRGLVTKPLAQGQRVVCSGRNVCSSGRPTRNTSVNLCQSSRGDTVSGHDG